VIPAQFEYVVAADLEQAIALLKQHPRARVLAGGQSLIPAMKTRALNPPLLVDISQLASLRGITCSGDVIRIGALTTHRAIEDSAELHERLPIMRETADLLADPSVRSRGTLGGSLAFADPGGDWPAVALALDARIHATGSDGTRTIAIDDFFIDALMTALQPDDIITHITMPDPPAHTAMAYVKLRHPSSGYALVGVAAVVGTGDNGLCQSCRIAVTGAGPHAARALAAERLLVGQLLNKDSIVRAAEHAAAGLRFLSDIYAGEGYRAHLTRVYVRGALLAAAARLVGNDRNHAPTG
jgi:carbon-monoxide dehydrogenase medium subunit